MATAPDLLFSPRAAAMTLPFTKDQFFDLLAAYNAQLWPWLIALWVASLVICVVLASGRRLPDRWISGLLAVHWAWSALAYHVGYFTRINPAAWIFAALFIIEAALLFSSGVVRDKISFSRWPNAWAPVAWALIAFAMAYPAINAAQHQTLLGIPAFGVPCPTMIFTAGMLMLATPRSWPLAIVPVIWSLIGGSAAFLLGVQADYALPIAGVALLIFSMQSRPSSSTARRRERATAI